MLPASEVLALVIEAFLTDPVAVNHKPNMI
jgi:hypothetical protein